MPEHEGVREYERQVTAAERFFARSPFAVVTMVARILVKAHAASLNAADLETLRGEFIVRIASPRKPMHQVLGSDIAGRVEAVGRDVVEFRPGDEVWGDPSFPHALGAFAEYVCASEKALAPKPFLCHTSPLRRLPETGEWIECILPLHAGARRFIQANIVL